MEDFASFFYKDEELSVIEKILDEENDDPITMYDEEGNCFKFEQVAVIPYEGELYAILYPIDQVEGVEEAEALVFHLMFDEEAETEEEAIKNGYIEIEYDMDTAEAVFDLYLDMLDEE